MFFSWLDRCASPCVLMMGTSNLPNSLSGKWVDSFPTESSYLGILAFPLSYFELSRDVLWSLGGSCGPLNMVEIGLSSVVSLCRSSSSKSIISKFVSMRSDGVELIVHQDVDSSNTTSLLTHTFFVEGLKHLYSFSSSDYPMSWRIWLYNGRIHTIPLGQTRFRTFL